MPDRRAKPNPGRSFAQKCATPASRGGSEGSVSRVLYCGFVSSTSAMIIHLGLPLLTGSSSQPGSLGRTALKHPLSGLAPSGVYLADPVTGAACALLPHPFNVTDTRRCPGSQHHHARGFVMLRRRMRTWQSTLCCTFLRVTPTGSYPAPCPVELGLSSRGANPPAITLTPPTPDE